MLETNRHTLHEHKGSVLIPSIAYGDAAGLPVEIRSAAYIQEKYGRIRELIPTKENQFYPGDHDPGMWSDDTQLSLAVAEALIEANGFSLDVIAEAHIKAYDETQEVMRNGKLVKRGWGGSTTQALEKLKAGVSPEESGTEGGPGNGILMKMAPLVYWQAVRDVSANERYEQYDQLTAMTHVNPMTQLTTRVHGDVLHHLYKNGYDIEAFYEKIMESASYHESVTKVEGDLTELLSYLPSLTSAEDILENTDGKGFKSPHTLAMAYGAFMLNNAQFADSVYEAVNLGGDTDSTASMVAAMSVFASNDIVRIPIDHQQLAELPRLKRVSRQLALRAIS